MEFTTDPSTAVALFAATCLAQAPPAEPYATLNHDAVNYNAPGGDAGHDLPGTDIRLGLLAPLAGPRQTEGEALGRAAQMAIEEENTASLPAGRRLVLVTRDQSGPLWKLKPPRLRMFGTYGTILVCRSETGNLVNMGCFLQQRSMSRDRCSERWR